MDRDASSVMARCKELRQYWTSRNKKMKVWYRLIQQVDELKTDKMESFVGNDARSMYNLVLHMLDVKIPHRVAEYDTGDFALAASAAEVNKFFDTAWDDNERTFRKTGPRQSMSRANIGLMLATGWYSVFSIVTDDGSRTFTDIWHPAETFPMWDIDMGLSEVAHITEMATSRASRLARRNGWKLNAKTGSTTTIYDYWWAMVDEDFPHTLTVWDAVVIGTELVKFEQTRFRKIPIYIAPIGGLPDTGALSGGTANGTTTSPDQWKEEIGQSIVATNEHIYRTWNKWWTFSMQLLRDTAQPRIFERSRSGKAIVKPEDVFRRGAIFRGGPDDSVDFIGAPPMPLELRSTQLDLEAMMQRGGVSWAMFGNVTGQMTAYVMSQIAASANQVMRPFHQAIENLYEDIDNDWLNDIRERGVSPYGWSIPKDLPKDTTVVAKFEVEIPGDLVQRATVARMLDPEFRLSYSYVLQKLFPEIKNPMVERARVRTDQAEMHPSNAVIALIQYYRKQSAYLDKIGDSQSARLYDLAADAAVATLTPQQPVAGAAPGGRGEGGFAMGRPEAIPPTLPETV